MKRFRKFSVLFTALVLVMSGCSDNPSEPLYGDISTSDSVTAHESEAVSESAETGGESDYSETLPERVPSSAAETEDCPSESETGTEDTDAGLTQEEPDNSSEDSFELKWNSFYLTVQNVAELYLPADEEKLDRLADCEMLEITLTEKTDLSFVTELPRLKGLVIYNVEPSPCYDTAEFSLVESYDFLGELDGLEYLRIDGEPDFNTRYLENMSSLEYLFFSATNIVFEGSFPNVKELTIIAGDPSSEELYDFFPNLTGLELYYQHIGLASVGKMEKLESLKLCYGRYEELSALAGNKALRSLVLLFFDPVEDGEFLFELTNLREFACGEGVFPEETIARFKEIVPDCEVFDKLQG